MTRRTAAMQRVCSTVEQAAAELQTHCIPPAAYSQGFPLGSVLQVPPRITTRQANELDEPWGLPSHQL